MQRVKKKKKKYLGGCIHTLPKMQRVKKKKSIWLDVFINYQKKKKKSGKYTPVTFDDFVSECLHYSVNIRRGKGVVRIGNWMDCGIISLGQFLWSALISFLQ